MQIGGATPFQTVDIRSSAQGHRSVVIPNVCESMPKEWITPSVT